jgi:anion-transporting  ArsA/GET3 family ATPase
MASALECRLIVVTGKGGVGKTTVSAALGLLGARRGLRTIVVGVTGGEAEDNATEASGLSALLGHPEPLVQGVEVDLQEGLLWGLSIDRDRVLAEWLRAIGGRVPARVLTSSASFQYLIAAAPGAREMISMVKVWELAEGRRPADRAANERRPGAGTRDYDLVVLDAPATGHALAMLRSPQTFSTIARVGPIARQAGQVRDLLADPARSAYVAVAQATEMGVTETLELSEGLHRELDRELHAVIVNGTLPRRFESGELRRIAALGGRTSGGSVQRRSTSRGGPTLGESMRSSAPSGAVRGEPPPGGGAANGGLERMASGGDAAGAAVTHSAARAAHAVHERARTQQRQIARLRRGARSYGSPPVLRVPFLFRGELDLEAVRRIASTLERGL